MELVKRLLRVIAAGILWSGNREERGKLRQAVTGYPCFLLSIIWAIIFDTKSYPQLQQRFQHGNYVEQQRNF